jgi:hypothetical protein
MEDREEPTVAEEEIEDGEKKAAVAGKGRDM